MKKWYKYIFLIASLIALVTGNYYTKTTSFSYSSLIPKKTSKYKAELKNVTTYNYQISEHNNMLVELDEEDAPHTTAISDVSVDFLSNVISCSVLSEPLLWRKIAFRNTILGTLQGNLYLPNNNIRI